MTPTMTPTSPTAFTLVVAADRDGGIGLRGALPWHLPPDLRRFKQLTTGAGRNAVLMGHATWRSLPASARPLPDRLNVVLSRTPGLALPAPALTAPSLDAALALATPCDAAFVIGGGELFATALADPRCAAVELTRLDAAFPCDTFLAFPRPDFHLAAASPSARHGDLTYRFERWERLPAPQGRP